MRAAPAASVAPLTRLAEEAIAWVRAQAPAGDEAEIYMSRAEERGVELREGRLDGISHSSAEGVGLRLLSRGRMAFAAAAVASPETVQHIYRKAHAQLDYVEPDPHKAFAEPSDVDAAPGTEASHALADSLWDDTLFSEPADAALPRLEQAGAVALGVDARVGSVLRLGYSESRGEVVIANTRGVLAVERGGSASVGLSTLSEQDGELQVGSAFQSSRRRRELDFDKVARQAAERTVQLLGGRKMPTGRRAVIFDPWVAGEFLDLISGLLCADQVQRGKSLLAGRLGARVGSGLVSFIDDPRMPGGLSSSLYDDEGYPTRRKTMVDKGVLREFFYDTYTANRADRASNACAGRGSYRGLPSPGCSNFYLAPGKSTREAILADTRDGILVLDVMGMHMADPVSGEFSVGVSGLALENGKSAGPVKGAMISGNLLQLLERIDAVGDDLTFYGSLGAPTFRVAHLSVA